MKRTTVLSVLALAALSHPARADIVGGDDVKPADPIRASTAALYQPSPDGKGGSLCTASILGKDIALTAAHCVQPKGAKPVLIFGNDLHQPGDPKRPVTAVKVNSDWSKKQGVGMDQGDIALVKFGGGLPDGYQPATMMPSDSSLKKGNRVTLAGYGITNPGTHEGAGTLRKTTVSLEDPRPGKTEMILDQTHGHGACHGDSGGPAYVRKGGKMELAGLTNRSYPDSAPDDCAHKVVYTKVGAYQPWIKKEEAALEKGSAHAGPDAAGSETAGEGYAARAAAHDQKTRSHAHAKTRAVAQSRGRARSHAPTRAKTHARGRTRSHAPRHASVSARRRPVRRAS